MREDTAMDHGPRNSDTLAERLSMLRALALFDGLHERLLQPVAAATRVHRLHSGTWVPAQPGSLCFVAQGSVRLFRAGEQTRRIEAGKPAAGYPLPLPQGWQLHADGGCVLLEIPERYLRLGCPRAPDSTATLEIPEGAVAAATFLTFYRALRSGKVQLPSMPELMLRIGEAIDDPATVNDDIATVIHADPALAANLMRIVNNAAYAGSGRIDTLPDAVARLGRRRVRNLVFSFILKNLFRTDNVALRQRMRRLWHYSCRVSAISFVLARHLPGLDPERALLAGLVHRIGEVPILNAARDYPTVAAIPEVLDAVVAHLSHEMTDLTLRKWDFGVMFIDIARDADDWLRPGWALPDYLDVVILAQLHARIGERERAGLPPMERVPALRKLGTGGLTPRQSLLLLEEAEEEIGQVSRLLMGN
jgi:HD-like signal output (HDOD) protein